jgi:periplasmic protein TonB
MASGSRYAAHTDILDQPDPLRRFLVWSLILHGLLAVSVVATNWIHPGRREPWGDINGGGIGSVAVGLVKTVPLPSRSGQTNPLANDTESAVPTPPPKSRPRPRVVAPEPDAIALRSRNAEKKSQPPASAPNRWREQQKDLPNQVYSNAGQRVVSSMYGMTGGGGVGVGNNSPFGTQLGWYATLLRDQVARNWRTGDLDPRLQTAPPLIVAFTIRRNGSVVSGSVRVVQRSGNAGLDLSAQRAVLDAAPFPAIPAQFPRDEADIELTFQLRR